MKTIQKRADQLVEGDIVANPGAKRGVVLRIVNSGALTYLEIGALGRTGSFKGGRLEVAFDSQYTVETRDDLTPAQQHADELVDELRRLRSYYKNLAGSMGGDVLRSVDDLLAKIDPPPPKPVTLDEALAALRLFEAETMTTQQYGDAVEEARGIVKRARLAGQP